VKEDRIYLLHIREALERILLYTAHDKQAFFVDFIRESFCLSCPQFASTGQLRGGLSDRPRDS
jgi:hypothetical protein